MWLGYKQPSQALGECSTPFERKSWRTFALSFGRLVRLTKWPQDDGFSNSFSSIKRLKLYILLFCFDWNHLRCNECPDTPLGKRICSVFRWTQLDKVHFSHGKGHCGNDSKRWDGRLIDRHRMNQHINEIIKFNYMSLHTNFSNQSCLLINPYLYC